jgi:hypothetical protein
MEVVTERNCNDTVSSKIFEPRNYKRQIAETYQVLHGNILQTYLPEAGQLRYRWAL